VAREQGRSVRLEANALDALDELVPCCRLAATHEIDVDDLGEQALEIVRAHPHGDQQIVLTCRVLSEARRPFCAVKREVR
jgi:hypothetical protein